jgi:hypothetical protein
MANVSIEQWKRCLWQLHIFEQAGLLHCTVSTNIAYRTDHFRQTEPRKTRYFFAYRASSWWWLERLQAVLEDI